LRMKDLAAPDEVGNKSGAGGAAAGVVQERRQEKEIMTEFIAKKREMFLVQMSLDTKREEIRKLEEKAQMKEEALLKSEQMLEEVRLCGEYTRHLSHITLCFAFLLKHHNVHHRTQFGSTLS